MKYELLKKFIRNIIKEEHHTKYSPGNASNNSIVTTDVGNISYRDKINKYYIIEEPHDYSDPLDTFKLIIKVREHEKDNLKNNGMSIDDISYSSSDEDIFDNEKRKIIEKLFVDLGNCDL